MFFFFFRTLSPVKLTCSTPSRNKAQRRSLMLSRCLLPVPQNHQTLRTSHFSCGMKKLKSLSSLRRHLNLARRSNPTGFKAPFPKKRGKRNYSWTGKSCHCSGNSIQVSKQQPTCKKTFLLSAHFFVHRYDGWAAKFGQRLSQLPVCFPYPV